ncbi:hypothetical protein O181_012818 [Austropuccinia psidii MF-1]|uniref:Uncharacterized protein n=1 Tax=Austropuccinia psidii MF-1 TaxID=1389203 RepID=A0A9Q3BXH2_9BASI|nr:hypothetical protein [Austropuccinia psidii MF-1]
MKIFKRCGGNLENALRRRFIEPYSTEDYNNAVEDIVTKTKIGRTSKEFNIKSTNQPLIKKDKQREHFKPNTPSTNEQNKFHKCHVFGHLANNCLKNEKINEIGETEDLNEKEEESDSEKDTEEYDTSESDEINIISSQTNNIDLIYEVLDINSNIPQVGTADTSLTNIPDTKLHKAKPEKGMGYTAGKSSIRIVRVQNKEKKVNLDTGAYCTYFSESYLQTIIPIQGFEFFSASKSMKCLGIIDLRLIFLLLPNA